jgi:hypothetical protein
MQQKHGVTGSRFQIMRLMFTYTDFETLDATISAQVNGRLVIACHVDSLMVTHGVAQDNNKSLAQDHMLFNLNAHY